MEYMSETKPKREKIISTYMVRMEIQTAIRYILKD